VKNEESCCCCVLAFARAAGGIVSALSGAVTNEAGQTLLSILVVIGVIE